MSSISAELIGIVTSIVLLAIVIPLGYSQWRKSRRMYSRTIDPEVLHDYNCEFLDPLPAYDHPPDYEANPPNYDSQQHNMAQIPQSIYNPDIRITVNDQRNDV